MNLKSVGLLLSLLYASSAIALGLGELSVRSHLGQALHVTVKILGTNAATAAGCFSLAPAEGAAVPPPRAQLSLDQGDGQALLHIRTTYTVNDPVAQFSLISDCESRLRRDYVVLLDPPEREAPVLRQEIPAATTQAKVARAEPPPPTSRSPHKPKPKRASPPRPSDSSTQASPPRKQTVQKVQEPRLVLSGRHGANSAALALRLDTNLPDMNRPHPNTLTPDELSDENTALSRKLAHLEAQLVALQKRNTEIEKKRTGVSTAQAPNRFTLPAQWPLYLLLTGLLVTAGILVVLLRQRGTHTKADPLSSMSAASQPDFDEMTTDPWIETVPKSRIAESGIERSTTLPESERILEFEPSTSEQTTEVNDGILDQAEVYMAHGHGDLAVHLLQEHLRDAPDESPVPWLLLLDLLHREGDTEGYTAASIECRRHFNVNLSSHPVSQESDTSHGLEDYPHLLEQAVVVWGTPAVEDFFNDLIFDKRGGTRVGFDPGAYRDILLLRAISRSNHPLAA
ncbi:MAG: hypothetical protein GZ085_11405 [Sulfuriferula multivorans]|uniref:FimV N-terminal domain-containing protein n=1 Tax=Sulfuriferula multivorans TaxID=1559896 RepID=A0A7C9TDA5_9PROT|nr:hypothetical protein [Sulfuriferula multivorans]